MYLTATVLALSLMAASEEVETTELKPKPYVDRLIPVLSRLYGIRSRDDLRAALDVPAAGRPRNDAWLASWIGDTPRCLEIFAALRQRDPSDGEAVLQAAIEESRLGKDEQALRELEQAAHRNLRQVDPRGSRFSAGDLLSQICRLQRGLGLLERARSSCQAAIDAGAQAAGSRSLSRVLLALGAADSALQRAEDALRANPTASAWYAKAISLEALGHRPEAIEAFKAALRADPHYTPAQWALDTPSATSAARLQLDLGFQIANDAEWTGRCGHIYLELQMPDRARRCFEESERIGGGLGDAERIYHLAETQPSAALDRTEAIPPGQRHRLLWWLIAAIHHQQGRDAAARAALERTLDKDPRYAKAHKLYVEVCRALHDEPCAQHHAAVMEGAPGR